VGAEQGDGGERMQDTGRRRLKMKEKVMRRIVRHSSACGSAGYGTGTV
jgi:hypothetical protein